MRLTWQVHTMHARNGAWLRGNQDGEMSYVLEPVMHTTCTKRGVDTWKLSALDPWKAHSACTKGAWN